MFKLLKDITLDACYSVKYFFKNNVRYIASTINVSVPYYMYVIGQRVALSRGVFFIGGEVFIPAAACVVVYYMRQAVRRNNKQTSMPLPTKRFTSVYDDTGEITIDRRRLEELLVYMADLEDWMERVRLL